MKKALKTALIILIVLLIIGTAIGGYFIWRHHALYIGADAAFGAALDDAGVLAAETFDVDVDFEHKYGRSCYEVQFKPAEGEYDYIVAAGRGEVLKAAEKNRAAPPRPPVVRGPAASDL